VYSVSSRLLGCVVVVVFFVTVLYIVAGSSLCDDDECNDAGTAVEYTPRTGGLAAAGGEPVTAAVVL
jgi:hypothetical protein